MVENIEEVETDVQVCALSTPGTQSKILANGDIGREVARPPEAIASDTRKVLKGIVSVDDRAEVRWPAAGENTPRLKEIAV